MLCAVFAIIPPKAEDAPTIVVFDGVPLFDRMVDACFATDNSLTKEEWTERLKAFGFNDKVLTKVSVMLVTAKQSGEWPSFESRLEDGSLVCWQLLTLNNAKTLKQVIELNAKRRRAAKN